MVVKCCARPASTTASCAAVAFEARVRAWGKIAEKYGPVAAINNLSKTHAILYRSLFSSTAQNISVVEDLLNCDGIITFIFKGGVLFNISTHSMGKVYSFKHTIARCGIIIMFEGLACNIPAWQLSSCARSDEVINYTGSCYQKRPDTCIKELGRITYFCTEIIR